MTTRCRWSAARAASRHSHQQRRSDGHEHTDDPPPAHGGGNDRDYAGPPQDPETGPRPPSAPDVCGGAGSRARDERELNSIGLDVR